jgi:hypothetical protein
MRRALLLFLVILCVGGMVAGENEAHAVGLGGYGSLGAGSANWSPDNGTDFKKDTNHFGLGLVMDTAPARDQLFNYQLNIGYDRFRNKNSNGWGDADLDGFVISNNFGFGALITPRTRFWFGPELRLEWASGTPAKAPNGRINLFGLGVGPVVGLNFNTGAKETFVVKTGFQIVSYFSTDWISDYNVSEKFFYITLEYLFRTSADR